MSSHKKKSLLKSEEDVITGFVLTHGLRYGYSLVKYTGSKNKVKIICEEHGVFEQTPNNHQKGGNCPKCGNMRRSEALIGNQEGFVSRAVAAHPDKDYDYREAVYTKSNEKVKIGCKKHGPFWQTPASHIHDKQGCPTCAVERSTSINNDRCFSLDEFVDISNGVHDFEYDYSKSVYINSRTPIEIICKKHGSFVQNPNHHMRGHGCPSCANLKSKHELEIFEFVVSLGLSAERGKKNIIGNGQEVDIYIPEKKLAIEYNGLRWHSESFGEKDKNYHLNKTTLLAEKGIRLIHIFEDEWIYKREIVKTCLKGAVFSLSEKGVGYEIREISAKEKNEFLEKTHIQGGDRASVSLGAYHGEELVAVMSFCMTDKVGVVELSRFSITPDPPSIGVTGKLLSFYEDKYKPSEIISYADKRWYESGTYKALGFEKINDGAPNYWYFKTSGAKSDKNWRRRFYREAFARHTLEEKFGKPFPKEMSEWQIMQSEGWDRIWDCGNILFSKKYN